MSSAARTKAPSNKEYPTSDGRPMAETDLHRDLMFDLINTLRDFYADDPNVYVSVNLLLFYVPGDKRRHLSPDVFVVKGVPKQERLNYLTWEEGKGPDVVIEVTSSSTRKEDLNKKFTLYERTLKVPEYFLFDPMGDYLDPPMGGYRLRQGGYQPIRAVKGRLPSRVLGLHLERVGKALRLFDPATDRLLPTSQERVEQAEARVDHAEARVEQAQAENERLRQEVEELRRSLRGGNGRQRS
jgi:Uma2 family endonuclease